MSQSSLPLDFSGCILSGRYLIESLIGRGGMGSVWKGHHVVTGRKVAVKILDPKFLGNEHIVRRFGREARAASAISHESIVDVLDLDRTEEGLPFLVMEYLEGESLADRLDRVGVLSEDEMLTIADQLLDALHAAHTAGVIHRDLKPANIFLASSPRGERVKILDFGISWKQNDLDTKLTITGSILGTPHYMSPEQARGETALDHRIDIYAAGVVLYECLVGSVPFDAPNYNQLLRVILDTEPTPPSQRGVKVSPGVEQVILQALAKNPNERPQSAEEMRKRLLASRHKRHGSGAFADKSAVGFGILSEPLSAPFFPPPQPNQRSDDSVVARWLAADLSFAPPEPLSSKTPSSPRMHAVAEADLSLTQGEPLSPPPSDPGLSLPESEAVPPPPLELELTPNRERKRSSFSRLPAISEEQPSKLDDILPPPPPSPLEIPHQPDRPTSVQQPSTPLTNANQTGQNPKQLSQNRSWSSLLLWGVLGVVVFGFLLLLPRNRSTTPTTPSTIPPSVHEDFSPEQNTASPKTNRPTSPIEIVTVTVEVVPHPAQLKMTLDGVPGATSPLRVRRGTQHVLELSAPGFQNARVEFTAEQNQRLRVRLEPLP
ncbi:MAG: serine/threonine protein kinase [Sandaracinaceae bacterium]|nr:serine/threonine protein kinase [Sandaracinaceae bacterium]MDW8245325.1 serine/threonine-protein kinase [Sandaracinaceae bacterium]